MRIVVAILAVFSFAACGEGVQPDQREVVYFTAVETDNPEPREIEDPGPGVPTEQLNRSKPIVDGFLRNHEGLLKESEIRRQIDRIERIFMATGDYHKFVGILRDDYELRGTDSFVADRYAWALIRLGQRDQAREILDDLLAAKPANADVQFLEGAFWLQEQPRTEEASAKTLKAWQSVLALDPDYRGYDVNATVLQQQIDALKEQLPSEAVQGDDSMRAMAETLLAKAQEAEQEAEQKAGQAAGEQAAEGTAAPEEAKPEEIAPETEGTDDEADETTEQPAEVAPPDPNAPTSKSKQYRILVAKGQIALSAGKYTDAAQSFVQARAIKPNDFAAEFGQLQALWGQNQNRNEVANRLRRLAEKPDLKPKQRVELGTFLWTKMARKDLAQKLFEAAKTADPSLSGEVDGLLQQMQ